jgi:single-stranded-DNA-specific exonuclease
MRRGSPAAGMLASRLPARAAHQCGGRIGRADLGVRLLLEDDATRPAAMAAELDRLNRERQVIEQQTWREAEAEALAALGIEEKGAVVVTAGQAGIPAWSGWSRRG